MNNLSLLTLSLTTILTLGTVANAAPPSHAAYGPAGSSRATDTRTDMQRKIDAMLEAVRTARRHSKKTLNSFEFAKGAQYGITTSGIFGQKPNAFQQASANGALAGANADFKQLKKELEALKEKAKSFDADLKGLGRTDINSTLLAEFTVGTLWGYDSPGHYVYFNLTKIQNIKDAEKQVKATDADLAKLETKLVELRAGAK